MAKSNVAPMANVRLEHAVEFEGIVYGPGAKVAVPAALATVFPAAGDETLLEAEPDAEAQVEKLRGECALYSGQVTRLSTENAQLMQEKTGLQSQIEEISSTLEATRAESAECLKQVESDKDALAAEIVALKAEIKAQQTAPSQEQTSMPASVEAAH